MFQVGQGILGKIPFKDGSMPAYNRIYLTVSVSNTHIGVLNVSSVAGKEHKLLYPSNLKLKKYNPPFLKDSFVKLDSLVYVPIATASVYILHAGDCLDRVELQEVLAALQPYN